MVKAGAGSSGDKEEKKDTEVILVEKEKRMNEDNEREKSEASKERALQKLKEIYDGKQRMMESVVPTVEKSKRKQTIKFSRVVESGEEGAPGPNKRIKLEMIGPMEGKEEFVRYSK